MDKNKLISARKKCTDDCKKDSYYIFEYNQNCLSICPENLKIDAETKHCLDNCYDDQIDFDGMCYDDFPYDNSDFFNDGDIVYLLKILLI